MQKMKMLFLSIPLVGIAGGAVAFKIHKFGNLTYYACGTDQKCDNQGTLSFAKVSTNTTDPVAVGVLTSSTIHCNNNADCGIFHYTTDL